MIVTPLRLVQAGVETTPGTAVPATRIIDMEDGGANLVTEQAPIVVANAGSLATGHRAYPGPYRSRVEFTDLPVSYDDLPWFWNLVSTPQATGAGALADRTYTNVPHDTADDGRRVTLEVGGRDAWPAEFRLAGCAGRQISITIERDGLWRMSATLLGTLLAKAARTGALSARTVMHVVAAGTRVFLDSTASAFGTTQVTGRVLSARVDIENGLAQIHTLDGVAADALAPARTALTARRTVGARIVAAFTSIAEFDAWRAASGQRLRISQTGPALGGSSYSAQINIGGTWQSWVLGDQDGLVTAELELAALHDTSIAADWRAVTVNAQVSL